VKNEGSNFNAMNLALKSIVKQWVLRKVFKGLALAIHFPKFFSMPQHMTKCAKD
jgi:hypothetical protein